MPEDFLYLKTKQNTLCSRSMASKTPVGFIGQGNMADIITMLPASINAREAYSERLLIDFSTMDPTGSKELAKEMEKMGTFSWIPLSFMVREAEDKFVAVQESLRCMCSNVVYYGAVGTSTDLEIQVGLDSKLFAKILNMSSGWCWSSDTTLTKSPILLDSQAQVYRMMCAKGYSEKDFSCIFQFL
ncbi:unnamed protein product [Nyctereutes procyonoides]|uniref:(raccoon dog) hypothetical protein n=1 Tax=Nyctereutes procyonoides TaxID=34880 RepID=A0A811Y6D7_NYCPR|nr:unnamed protein product [Nyctereutes procyonoides]